MADTIPTTTSGQLAVRIVTPDRILIDTTAAPLLAELGAGEVRLHGGSSGDEKFFVAWGFVEVLPQRVTVLAEMAMKPNEIDPAQAQGELDQAQKDWNEAGDDADKYNYARGEIRVAEEKLAASKGR